MIILPSPKQFPRSLIMASFEVLATSIMADDNDTIQQTDVLTNEEMAIRIGFVQARKKAPNVIGDSVTISRSVTGSTAMCFLDYTCVGQESAAEYNTIASILHPAGLSVYGIAYFVHTNRNQMKKEDLIHILKKRMQHCGVVMTEPPQEITVNNGWRVLQGPEMPDLANRQKSVRNIDDDYFLILRGDPQVVFLFLDKELKTLDDLRIDTYEKLKKRLTGTNTVG